MLYKFGKDRWKIVAVRGLSFVTDGRTEWRTDADCFYIPLQRCWRGIKNGQNPSWDFHLWSNNKLFAPAPAQIVQEATIPPALHGYIESFGNAFDHIMEKYNTKNTMAAENTKTIPLDLTVEILFVFPQLHQHLMICWSLLWAFALLLLHHMSANTNHCIFNQMIN